MEYAEGERTLLRESFAEHYPTRLETVGHRALFDPDNEQMKS